MTIRKKAKHLKPALEDRFQFIGDGAVVGNRAALSSAIFDVEDKIAGFERSLKLWRKTGTPVDEDLRRLWLHEMRQVQRIMSYAGAREVIVDVIEFVEDDKDFGVVLDRVGQPLSERRKRVSRQHWLKNLGTPRSRILFWRNIKRIVSALGIVHNQGLVHGGVAPDAIMTEGSDEPDFRLGGFEWSLWVSADLVESSYAALGPDTASIRLPKYSFASDWQSVGLLIAQCLDAEFAPSGEVRSTKGENSVELHLSEKVLIRKLVSPARMDQLDAESIGHAIDDITVGIAQSASARAGTYILRFDRQSRLGEAVFAVTDGEIPIDEYQRQLEWVRADIDAGATILLPKSLESSTGWIRLVTDTMIYKLRSEKENGAPLWDIAICQSADLRTDNIALGDNDEHPLLQKVAVVPTAREAQELRARLGPDILDWSGLSGREAASSVISENEIIKRALLLVQVVEAVIKALEVYPVQILEAGRRDGRKFVLLRAEPNNDRDKVAKKIGLSESSVALSRLFEEEHRDAETKWCISQSPSLGASLKNDIAASFVDTVDHRGRRAYQFEIDDDLPEDGPFFLHAERDTGTEKVISRRLKNIKALDTRVDLTEMFSDPWLVRRSSRESISEDEKRDRDFQSLDESKQSALDDLWSTLPAYFVVGPPGVGKTKLATEVVRRRFSKDRSTRMLISAQGHDALDNLQSKVTETLADSNLVDIMVIRSTTPDKRPKSNEEVQKIGKDCLDKLYASSLGQGLPFALRARIRTLTEASVRLENQKEAVGREDRVALAAVSRLILDAANIVISTANSPDIERLVEEREQFDWVIIEEAAKATGPELVGPLMLSGRRLLIGDHHQLSPFEADRIGRLLSDHSLVTEALGLARQLVGPLLRDGELEELDVAADAANLREVAGRAVRLLEPFRTFVDDDERRVAANAGHRRISSTLVEQRRMDPAISEIVSRAFYSGRLKTQTERKRKAEEEKPTIQSLGAMPQSPVVVVDFPHVSSSGQGAGMEKGRPRWHNPEEVHAVINALKSLRSDSNKRSTLAVLSPYKAQVDKLHDAIEAARARELRHLNQFDPVRSNGSFVGTVDSFQGSEADLVILSLVRNNPRTGSRALGFLRDRRRMNVALSRAKSKLIIVGSLSFLDEAVRGVNPDEETHDLSFLTEITRALRHLASESRGNYALASIINPLVLKQKS